jgi:hypothetical protein
LVALEAAVNVPLLICEKEDLTAMGQGTENMLETYLNNPYYVGHCLVFGMVV